MDALPGPKGPSYLSRFHVVIPDRWTHRRGRPMPLTQADVKSIIAAMSGKRAARRLAFVVDVKRATETTTRHFFAIKIGGHGKGALAAGHVLNWMGNVAGGGVSSMPNVGSLGQLGSGLSTVGGKAGGLKGLGGAFNEGLIANFSDSGELQANRNAAFQLKSAGGVQGMGWLDLVENEA
ncbi:MAG: hypothetical protein PVI57_10435, partial [Gemmatimonadota bacterium]